MNTSYISLGIQDEQKLYHAWEYKMNKKSIIIGQQDEQKAIILCHSGATEFSVFARRRSLHS